MKFPIALLVLMSTAWVSSCSKKEIAEAPKPAAEEAAAPAPVTAPSGPHATVLLKSGDKIRGVIVASSATDMVVTGDDAIERKIPLGQIRSVSYDEAEAASKAPAQTAAERKPLKPSSPTASRKKPEGSSEAPVPSESASSTPPASEQSPLAPATQPVRIPKTFELPAGTEVSVRTNESIDSQTANEGESYDAQVTRNVTNEHNDLVIPRGSTARVVIKSASQGGRIRGASDLVLDLASVRINGKSYEVQAGSVGQKGDSGVGANKRTATYTGGGAALGAIIGAIAGGGKGAAIGAGAGAGAGALTQILTKGRTIKVPAESVLTFKLDRPLVVTAAE